MNESFIHIVVDELAAALTHGTPTRVFQLAAFRLALSFAGTHDNRLLFLSAEPARPRVYLIDRPHRLVDRAQLAPGNFALTLRKQIVGARLDALTQDANERVVRFTFSGTDDAGTPNTRVLVAQLTGRSANLFLLDGADRRIIDRLREARGAGQEIGERYAPPSNRTRDDNDATADIAATVNAAARQPKADELSALLASATDAHRSPSALLDDFDQAFERRARFRTRANAELTRLRRELQKRAKLRRNLHDDLLAHGDPAAHKRVGDLLLANIATHTREGARVRLTDYFADGAPQVELEIDENQTPQEAAAAAFTRYTKAKRAREEITARLDTLDEEIADFTLRVADLERISAEEDEAALDNLIGAKETNERNPRRSKARANSKPQSRIKRASPSDHIPGTRRYRSSDDFEIVVGRGARENDQVTFRLARPNDLWLHAADYPGAHVIVRNHTRAEVPHRTLVEAAQLAAAYSQAKEDSKVSVNYTARKFISKPKGAAPGLVRLANFKTLLVEPREAGERITNEQ